jgi:hypothetical protein
VHLLLTIVVSRVLPKAVLLLPLLLALVLLPNC